MHLGPILLFAALLFLASWLEGAFRFAQAQEVRPVPGHHEEEWQNEKFQQHLLGGIRWAPGDLADDATPRPKP